MGVDTDVIAGDRLDHFADDGFDLVRQRAAIGVAEHDPARAFVVGRLGAGQRELRISFVTVEEMLAIEQHLAAFSLCGAHAVADRREVFLVCSLERHLHVIIPGLRHEADRVRLGVEQRRKAGIVRGRAAGTARHAEGGKSGVELVLLREKLRVGRVCPRIAALDIVDAEIVQHTGDGELVVECEINAVGLRAVAQCGVEKIEAFARHRITTDNSSRVTQRLS